jgi:hypothetical protein
MNTWVPDPVKDEFVAGVPTRHRCGHWDTDDELPMKPAGEARCPRASARAENARELSRVGR